jgi:biopolymer transport protein ExbD
VGVSLSSGSKRRGEATPDINITPLVDVVLVLLIIFMVVTPALNEGAQIELPKVLTPDPKTKYINPRTPRPSTSTRSRSRSRRTVRPCSKKRRFS